MAAARLPRDRYLMPTAVGRGLVALYYRHSPPIADAIREQPVARATVRAVLWPVVWALKLSCTACTPYRPT